MIRSDPKKAFIPRIVLVVVYRADGAPTPPVICSEEDSIQIRFHQPELVNFLRNVARSPAVESLICIMNVR